MFGILKNKHFFHILSNFLLRIQVLQSELLAVLKNTTMLQRWLVTKFAPPHEYDIVVVSPAYTHSQYLTELREKLCNYISPKQTTFGHQVLRKRHSQKALTHFWNTSFMLLAHISNANTAIVHMHLPLQASELSAEGHSHGKLLLVLPVPTIDELALSAHHGELKYAGKF